MVVMPAIPEPKSPMVREEPAQIWTEPEMVEEQVNNISIEENVSAEPQPPQTVKQFPNEPIDDDEQFSTIKRSPHTKSIESQNEAIVQPSVVVATQQPVAAQVTTNEIGEYFKTKKSTPEGKTWFFYFRNQ
jgi:hypothetical protein